MFSIFGLQTPPTENYILSLHDALPISLDQQHRHQRRGQRRLCPDQQLRQLARGGSELPQLLVWAKRSEEHTSELQSLRHLVCRLLLEKKKNQAKNRQSTCVEILHNARR